MENGKLKNYEAIVFTEKNGTFRYGFKAYNEQRAWDFVNWKFKAGTYVIIGEFGIN